MPEREDGDLLPLTILDLPFEIGPGFLSDFRLYVTAPSIYQAFTQLSTT